MSARTDLKRRRLEAIATFLSENEDLFFLHEEDEVDGGGPFVVADWCLTLHLRDLSVDDYSDESAEVRAAFFRPGMTWSQKLGLVAALEDGVRYPEWTDDEGDL